MPSQYEKGEQIRSLDVLMEQEFIFCKHKVYHRGWFIGWTVNLANAYVKNGHIHMAVKKNKEDNELWKSNSR